MKFASDILIHFLDRAHRADPSAQLEVFKLIAKQGLRFAPSNMMLGQMPGETQVSIGLPVICFTDIPLTLTQAHTQRYGSFGLGFRKGVVKRWGGNPVLYLVDGGNDGMRGQFTSYVRKKLIEAQRTLTDSNVPSTLKDEVRSWTWLFAMFKEMADVGPNADQEVPDAQDRYYFEREWRVPLTDAHRECRYPFCARIGEGEGAHYFLKFAPADLVLVIVPDEGTRRKVIAWFGSADADLFLGSGSAREPAPAVVIYEHASEF